MTACNQKVDFVLAGAQKSGTSALDRYLRQHPRIRMADTKEVHFFDRARNFTAPGPDYRAYHRFFLPSEPQQIWGEATPVYMYSQDAPRRIHQYNTSMKVVLVLRDPVSRAFSHWNMLRDMGWESLSFWDALQAEPERCRSAAPRQRAWYSYIDRGRYARQIQRIWQYFDRSQTLIFKYETLRMAPRRLLDELCAFLDVGPLVDFCPLDSNTKPYVSSMSEREEAYLRALFDEEIKELEDLLGWDCSDWLKNGGQFT